MRLLCFLCSWFVCCFSSGLSSVFVFALVFSFACFLVASFCHPPFSCPQFWFIGHTFCFCMWVLSRLLLGHYFSPRRGFPKILICLFKVEWYIQYEKRQSTTASNEKRVMWNCLESTFSPLTCTHTNKHNELIKRSLQASDLYSVYLVIKAKGHEIKTASCVRTSSVF